VCIVPHTLKLREMDAKIGGNEMDRLRRWYRQGKLRRSRGIVASRFPKTPTPKQVARLIRRGVLHNARFAAAIVVRGVKSDEPLEIRWDAGFPTLYQLRARGLHASPVAYATAEIAAMFVRHFPREIPGVHAPGDLPAEARQAILNDARARGFKLTMKTTRLKKSEDDEEY
ncbi:MAG: hypothetical protein WBF06_12105, partial [Candidatus Acidiferrales bacterium]